MSKLKELFNKDELFKGSNLFYTILICMLWSNNVLLSYIRAVILRLPVISSFADEIIFAVICLCILMCINKFLTRIKAVDIIFVAVCIFVYFSHYTLYPQNQSYILSQAPTFLSVLVIYFIGVSFELENKALFDLLYYVSLINTVCFVFYNLFINEMEEKTARGGEMFLSYTILTHMCLIFYYMLKKANVINIAVFAAGVVIMFSLGNRGSIGCLAVFIVLALFFIYRKAHPLILIGIIAGFIIIIATPLFDIIYEWMNDFAVDNGLSTRIFDKFAEGELSDDSGRGILHEKVIAAISDNPLFGSGIMSDRRIAGGYVHNIVYEFMVDFGIIIGFGLLAVLFILFLRSCLCCKYDKDILAIIFIFFSRGVVRLFLSGSYLQEANFFFFIGICVAVLRSRKKE